jgi:bloom syndrome protein
LRQDFPNVPIMALTATANSSVVSDISSKLAMRRDFFTFKSSFNRPNLRYTILKKTKTSLAEISTYIKTKQFGKSGIIYCLSRKNCEQVSDELKKALPQMASKITYYHAELEADERARRHTQWTRGNIKLIVATVSLRTHTHAHALSYAHIPAGYGMYFRLTCASTLYLCLHVSVFFPSVEWRH